MKRLINNNKKALFEKLFHVRPSPSLNDKLTTTNANRERKQINESQAFIYSYKALKYQKKRKKKSEEQ